jgi:hypothetical protein
VFGHRKQRKSWPLRQLDRPHVVNAVVTAPAAAVAAPAISAAAGVPVVAARPARGGLGARPLR